ncbi:MAG: hypothetical protein AAFV43_07865 [Planctomycetota bacterium]
MPISGTVLVDGEPLPAGSIRFVPPDGRAASGKIVDGGFDLTCYERGDGAILGVHRVAVAGREIVGGEKVVWHAPRKYADFRTSGITQEVTEPDDSVVINLTWEGEKRRR